MYYYNPDEERDSYIEKAARHNENCTEASIIGEGTYGICFKLSNDSALKITCDKCEVMTAIAMMNKPVNSYPNIHSIKKDPDSELFFIEQDLCQEIAPKEYRALDNLCTEIDMFIEDSLEDNPEITTLKALKEMFESDALFHYEQDEMILDIIQAVENVSQFPFLKNLDFHVDNIMKIDGSFVLIDQKHTFMDTEKFEVVERVVSRFIAEDKTKQVDNNLEFYQ